MKSNKLKIATAFSGGFGSVEFAFKYENLKHKVVFACEWMKPQRVSYLLNHNDPTSNFYEDIHSLDGTKYKGQIDYYHLSPPCQSYSMAGKRNGAADARGRLMFQAIKSIDEVQPKMFSIENVRGLLNSNRGEDWKNILKDIKSLKGYSISWGIMNAKEQRTPQNRERVFIVGFRGTGPGMSFPPRIALDKVLRDVLEDDVDGKYYLSQKMIDGFTINNKSDFKFRPHTQKNTTSKCITASYSKMSKTNPYIAEKINKIGYINQDTQASQVLDIDGISASLCAGTHGYTQRYVANKLIQTGNIDQKGHNSLWGRVYSQDGIAPTQNAKGGGAGAKTGLFLIKSNTKCGYEVARDGDCISLSRPTSTTRRGRVGKQVSQTLDTSCSIGVLLINGEYFYIRRLTPREASRVQGDFDDRFKFGKASDTKLYQFIGNAMDISTTRNLITRMLEHSKIVKFTEPKEPSFSITDKKVNQINLFDIGVA
ncbi:MAG: hypothetical protein COB42_08200 [Sulfurimonas sp.]|nr:MAG: hypothetical protein COB42_08200 [Sulfurimonas sp.]